MERKSVHPVLALVRRGVACMPDRHALVIAAPCVESANEDFAHRRVFIQNVSLFRHVETAFSAVFRHVKLNGALFQLGREPLEAFRLTNLPLGIILSDSLDDARVVVADDRLEDGHGG